MTAAELLGRREASPRAVQALTAVVAAETPDKIYPENVLMFWADAMKKFNAEGRAEFLRGAGSSADAVKRHRVKLTAIEALGRLRAREAVPALCRILLDQREFYPVHSLACQALGRIGSAEALPVLAKAAEYPEVNTKYRAQDAMARIRHGRPACPDYPDRAGA